MAWRHTSVNRKQFLVFGFSLQLVNFCCENWTNSNMKYNISFTFANSIFLLDIYRHLSIHKTPSDIFCFGKKKNLKRKINLVQCINKIRKNNILSLLNISNNKQINLTLRAYELHRTRFARNNGNVCTMRTCKNIHMRTATHYNMQRNR